MAFDEADQQFMAIAMTECRESFAMGGIPVGAALVKDGKVLGRGRNLRVQEGSAIKHAETDAMENATKNKSPPEPPPASVYRGSTIYTTLIPCAMCTGAMLLYGIARVVYACRTDVVAKPDTIALLQDNGVECVYLEVKESGEMLRNWIEANPEIYENEPWATPKK